MKKILYSVAAMALAFFSASCQQENLEPVAGNNTVTYTVQVADAVATKAIGDVVPSDMVLHYEVYRTTDKDDSTLGDGTRLLYHKSEPMTSNPFTINLELVNDQNFTVLFWAQASGNTVIDPSDLKNVTVSQDDLTANQANYAAFSSVDFIEKGEQLGNRTISLVRPVSQINLGTTPESLKSFKTPITMSESSFTVNGLSTSFNVATQEAGSISAEDFTFDSAAVPTYDAADSLSVNGDNYAYAAMNYVGFAPKAGVNVSVSYVIKTSEGDIDNTIENVPVKPNYRTNIVGNLITEGAKYQVSLDANWTGVSNVVCTAADLKTALENAENGSEVVLNGNIDLSDLLAMTKSTGPLPIVIPEGKEVVLDLNGFNIIAPEQSAGRHYYAFDNYGDLTIKSSKSEGAILSRGIYNNGSMTLESGVISAIDQNGGYAINGKDGSTFVMNGGKLTTCEDDNFGQVNNGGYDATTLRIEVGGAATINGGIVENISDYTFAIDNNGTVVINGGEIKSVHSTISTYGNLTINGGSFICNGIEGITAHCLVAWEDSQTTINGGSFNGKDNYNGFNIDADEGAVVNITGGEFLPVHSGSLYGKGVIKVSGGTFFDDPSARLESGYKAEQKNDKYVVTEKDPVAKIGEKGYWSLNAAVAAVQDGETITLVADEVFTETNRSNNSGYWDGLAYSGDKSFTIDLGGHTIKQDGSLNDYLMWIKNDGAKANTITLKNGTMDAGTTAYSAFATASSNKQTIIVNLENINLINNISNGAVVKARGGSVLNVKAGTVITGKDSYVGIEAVGNNTVVNVYEGAEIYQNGTSSYVGAIIGASYNATLNLNGGKGQSAKCGIIVMSTGATINVSGGEWTANGDGTVAGDNRAVLVSQNNRYESGWACKSILNVTGGTFKGGYNCYGMGPGQEADDAQINIKGGNFNADPTTYVVAGYEAKEGNGNYVVSKKPEATVNGTPYVGTLAEAVATAKSGDTVAVIDDVTLSESLTLPAGIIFNGNGKQINGSIVAGGDLTFAGHTKVTSFSASYYNRTITIGVGACLEVTGTGRATLGYGNTFNITGSLENAKTADKADVQPSLIIPGGISITGGNDAAMNVTNAYVKIGSTTSKPGVANGNFALNFNNSIVEFSKELGFYEPTGGVNPTFKMNIENSVFTTGTKLFLTNGSKVTVDNSIVTLGTYIRNSGELVLKNGSTLTGATIQFGENGGNNGIITVDNSTLTVTASSTGSAFDGKGDGKIIAKNNAIVSVDYYKAMTIDVDETSTFTGTEVK